MNDAITFALKKDYLHAELGRDVRAEDGIAIWRRLIAECDRLDCFNLLVKSNRSFPFVIAGPYLLPEFSSETGVRCPHRIAWVDAHRDVIDGTRHVELALERSCQAVVRTHPSCVEAANWLVELTSSSACQAEQVARLAPRLRSDDRFRQIGETIQEVFYLSDASSDAMLYVNPAYEAHFGLGCSQLCNKPGSLYDAIAPQHHSTMRAARCAVLAGDLPEVEYQIRRPDGTTAWVRDRPFPVSNEQGNVTLIGGVTRDISSCKANENLVREGEEQLRGVFEAVTDAIMMVDRHGTIVTTNAACSQLFGYPSPQLIGSRINQCLSSQSEHWQGDIISRCLKVHAPNTTCCELLGQRQDGTTFPVEISVTEVDQSRLCAVVVRDVTRQKDADEVIRRAHELSDNIIQTAPIIVLVLDQEGHIVRFNPYLETLSGRRCADVRGKKWIDIFLVPEDRQHTHRVFDSALRGKETRGNVSILLTSSGDKREIQWDDAPLTNADGECVGLLCLGQDITERRKLEHELLRISAEEKRRIGQDLHDGAQQECTGLGLLAQNLTNGLDKLAGALKHDKYDQLTERIESLHAKSLRLRTGLEQASSHIQQLARGLVPVEVDGHGLMSALGDLARSVTDTQVVDCEFHANGEVTISDNILATHLYRIAQEAVNNGIKHSGADKIEILLSRDVDRVSLKIRDNGAGAEKPLSETSGLGMRIMRYRAEVVGGSLTVDSSERGVEVSCSARLNET